MASQTKSAGLGQSISTIGSIPWANPTRIYTSNNSRASTPLDRTDISYWLRATNFGFSIPGEATIDGIVAEFEKKASATGVYDFSAKIVSAGFEQGDERKESGAWPTSDTYISHGGVADDWGILWYPALINSSNFGVSISVRNPVTEAVITASIDHVRITVYYTIPPPDVIDVKVNIADSFKDITNVFIRDGTPGLDWKPVVKIQINIGDVWKTIFG